VARTLAHPTGSPTANLPYETFRVSAEHFLDVRLRPRRDRHRASVQAREAEGEALGTASAEKVTRSSKGNFTALAMQIQALSKTTPFWYNSHPHRQIGTSVDICCKPDF